MNVILLTSFKKLGILGDVVTVKPGFARNFLFPKGIASPATQENIEYFENQKRILEQKKSQKLFLIKKRVEEVRKINKIVIFSKSGNKGKLFGSINARDISRKFSELGIKIKKSEIKFKKGVLRTLGDHFILFQPHKDIYTEIKVSIVSKENK